MSTAVHSSAIVSPQARLGERVEIGPYAVIGPDAALGDEVVLLGDEITAEELAAKTDTITYEVFCRVSRRVPRLYA